MNITLFLFEYLHTPPKIKYSYVLCSSIADVNITNLITILWTYTRACVFSMYVFAMLFEYKHMLDKYWLPALSRLPALILSSLRYLRFQHSPPPMLASMPYVLIPIISASRAYSVIPELNCILCLISSLHWVGFPDLSLPLYAISLFPISLLLSPSSALSR